MSHPLVGAILAAGQGSRIQPLSADTPKPLLPLLHQPIIGYQIQRMRALGITEVYVVVGYFGNRLMQELGDGSRWGVQLSYLEQSTRDGIGHAVSLLEPKIGQRSFVLFLGDIFFELDRIERLRDALNDDSADSVLAVNRESNPAILRRNFEVLLADDGAVREVREKPREVEGDIKGCGLYLFSSEIFESIRRTPRSALRGEIELTDAIQVHIERGFRVVPAEVVERDWNISVPRDLLELNMHLLEENGANACVADSVELPPDLKIRKSVLLEGARVESGVELERCLLLSGAVVSSGKWRNTIFFEGRGTGLRLMGIRAALDAQLRARSSLVVAVSGGVDSAVLWHAAHRVLGERVSAVIAVSASLPARDLEEARELSKSFGSRLTELRTKEFEDERYLRNDALRCYHCRRTLFEAMVAWAEGSGFEALAYGEIADDALDERPGRRAAREFQVFAPLAEAGFTKEDVRAYAREFEIAVAERPASACLASRLPRGTRVTKQALARIERAEERVRALGFQVLRVRHHGEAARLEVGEGELARAHELESELRSSLELEGFRELVLAAYVDPSQR